MLYKLVISFAAVIFTALSTAFAAEALTEDQVRRFAEAIPALTAIADEMESEGLDDLFEEDDELQEGEPFQAYSKWIAKMKTVYPEYYAKVNSVAKDNNFKDAAEFGSVGDRTMHAYLALTSSSVTDTLPPEVLELMSADVQAEYRQAVSAMQALTNVPQADKDAVKPHMSLLDKILISTIGESEEFEGIEGIEFN